jgi:hypothetical protein
MTDCRAHRLAVVSSSNKPKDRIDQTHLSDLIQNTENA